MCKNRMTPRGIIYWMPTGESVSDFVNTKINPFIADNEEIAKSIGIKGGKSTDNQGLKFIYGTPFFVRGLKSKTKVKSISADAAIYDEFDEADPEQVVQARKRLSASSVKISMDISTPTINDYGIDKRFQETDKCHYAFKCGSCSRWNVLEEHFPNNFYHDANGDYYIGCHKCHTKLDLSQGTWFSLNERSKIRGYQISQLYSPFVSPNEIMHEYQTTSFMGHFYNHVLGLPYLSATDRVTSEMVLSLCDPMRVMPASHTKATAMGVDVGSKLHIVIIEPGVQTKVIWAGEITTFDQLDELILKFNVKQAVIDALPETRNSRFFVEKHKHKAFMCFYNDNQKGAYAFDEEIRQVLVNRTESMDVGQDMILKQKISLPQRNPMMEMLALHCANVAKVPEENKETGSIRLKYLKLGPDHLRHALNYALIAASRMSKGMAFGVFR
jgi:hypothetical protein